MLVMAKERKPKDAAPKEPAYPSRAEYKSTYLTKDLYAKLAVIAKEEDRSVSYLVHRAVREYLERHTESK